MPYVICVRPFEELKIRYDLRFHPNAFHHLRGRQSASKIANAAQSFGQEDDISVISVTRAAIPQPAMREEQRSPPKLMAGLVE